MSEQESNELIIEFTFSLLGALTGEVLNLEPIYKGIKALASFQNQLFNKLKVNQHKHKQEK